MYVHQIKCEYYFLKYMTINVVTNFQAHAFLNKYFLREGRQLQVP
jgi:hypothetical protein